MGLSIRTFPSGPLETNAYLVVDEESGAALVIDAPPEVTATLLTAIADAGARVERIILTHAHWDHIVDATALRDALGVPLLAHPLTKDRLTKPRSMLQELPFPSPPVTPDGWLDEGDTVELGSHTFQVLHLPGHDPAHIVLYSEPDRTILGGDVLFPGGHGTTEVPLADQVVMDQSLARLAALPGDVVVYPGHGRSTTLGAEASWLQPIAGRAG